MRIMRKLFLKLSMLLFVFTMSVNAAWADEPQKIYLASLKAQMAPESAGSGQVQLTWLDIKGKKMTSPLAQQIQPTNPVGPDETAQVLGGTLCAMDGVEVDLAEIGGSGSQIYMTSFLYFQADAVPANGSYFSHWTFSDPKITQLDTIGASRGGYYFKLLPDSANNALYPSPAVKTVAGQVMAAPNNIYAVFNKYLLSNPQAANGAVNATYPNSTQFNVTVDVEGDLNSFDLQDVALPTFSENSHSQWSYDMAGMTSTLVSERKIRVTVPVTFTTWDGITADTYKTILTIKMAGDAPSTLNVPLTVEARAVSDKDASVAINGGEPTAYATLAEAVTDANAASGDVVLTLLRDVQVKSTITLTNTMTLDLNGYELYTDTVTNAEFNQGKGMVGKPVLKVSASGKTITLVYNKVGGAIHTKPAINMGGFGMYMADGIGVEVENGTLVLNGGTIIAENGVVDYELYGQQILAIAVKVDANGTLIQNGATIEAISAGPKAFGIYNEGKVTVNDGSVSATADFNTAMAVMANDGSTTTINGGSLYSLAKEEDGTEDIDESLTPAAIATWTNSYAVSAQPGSTVTVNGGTLFAEAINADRAYTVACLAGFGGSLTINKKAVVHAKSPNNMYSFPLAIMGGPVTINGGKYIGECKSWRTGNDTICPPAFGVDFTYVTFKSGYSQTEKFFHEDDRFPTSDDHPTYTNYNIAYGLKEYSEGFRYIAVSEENTTPKEAGVAVARIGSTGYTTLEDAIAYANNNTDKELVIFMTNDYTLPAGNYTIPAKATLVVPMSDTQEREANKTCPRIVFNDMQTDHPYVKPFEFRRLTFANGVNMDVYGAIELTCTQFSSNESYTSQPYGAYGRLVMEEGSHMTLQGGSELRAWGYMTGTGETDARRNATVREMFQMGDWKGAMTSVKITGMAHGVVADHSDKKIFPVTQYFIQNVESPVKYHPGAVLTTTATVSEGLIGTLAVAMSANDIKIVGVSGRDASIFLMNDEADSENTWVRKWYDAEHDVQVYDVNSAADIGSMLLDMGELNIPIGNFGTIPVRLNSAKFDLPITSNMKIHLLTGSMNFEQNTSLLPGAEVEVDKGATVSVFISAEDTAKLERWHAAIEAGEEPNPADTVLYTGALYVYDQANWDKYAYCKVVEKDENDNWNTTTGTAFTKVVRYTPWDDEEGGRPFTRDEQTCPPSAAINVHGTFDTQAGYVYTSAAGANIFSQNADAGTFKFNQDASVAGSRTVYQVEGEGTFVPRTFTSAKLKNKVGYAETSTARVGDAYCYKDDKWTILKIDDDNNCFMVDNYGTFYAKPKDYISVVATKDGEGNITGNADHTFCDAEGQNRLFILIENFCQWWEVEKVGSLYHCIHPSNDTYYYWDESAKTWKVKTFTIKWRNWNGDPVMTNIDDKHTTDSYVVAYNTNVEFLGSNPTHIASADSTFDFIGWKRAGDATIYNNFNLPRATEDVTYMAVYEAKQRKYTITFENEGESPIETQFLPLGATPQCENMPTKIGHILQWKPAIAPVTGDMTYTATWLEEPPTTCTVIWRNYNGAVLETDEEFALGTQPEYNGATPTKVDANSNYTYSFVGWKRADDNTLYTASTLPNTTEDVTYVAQFEQAIKTYRVRFYEATVDGGAQLGADQNLAYGATPVVPEYSKASTDAMTYTLVWTPLVGTVTGDQDYHASFTEQTRQYTVTWKNYDGSTITTDYVNYNGTPVYSFATPTKPAANNKIYTFSGWDHAIATVTDNQVYTAQFEERDAEMDVTTAEVLTSSVDVQNITIEPTGTLTVNPGVVITTDMLTLQANEDASGQLIATKVNATVAHYELKFENGARRHWHAFGVPWQVDLDATPIREVETGRTFFLGHDYDIIYYNGAKRAAEGPGASCWEYVEHNSHILQPGQGYMIAFTIDVQTLRFTKKADAPVIYNGDFAVAANNGGAATDNGINAIANPMAYHATLDVAGVAQVHDGGEIGSDGYDPVTIANMRYIVGKTVYVQVDAAQSIVVEKAGSSVPVVAAPSRKVQKTTDKKYLTLEDYYTVSLTNANGIGNKLYVLPEEDKENKYVIGHDLVKMGMSTKKAQIWINRYGANLGLNTTAPVEGVAEFPINLYAPAAGEYTISSIQPSVVSDQNDYTVYLTQNGEAIWNLSDAPYALSLSAGVNKTYGLRLSARKSPQTTTGIDEAVVDAQGETRKVLINNQVFIIRGNNVYSVDGQLVK